MNTLLAFSIGYLVINRLLVENGYAWVDEWYCKRAFCNEWEELEAGAREEKRGLLAEPRCNPPMGIQTCRKTEIERPAGSGDALYDCSGNRYNCSDFQTHHKAQRC
jgi:hypothetical protein